MIKVGFTSSRNIKGVNPSLFSDQLRQLTYANEFIYGGCVGGDHAIAEWLTRYGSQSARHRVIVPANRRLVMEWWKLSDTAEPFPYVEYMPDDTTYKDRNQRIVDLSDELEGFPEYSEHDPRSKRSGTWQTIRMGRRKGIPVRVTILREV